MPDPVVPPAQVAHEALALEVIFLLLETPSADSVEVAVAFVKEVGAFLQDISPQALNRRARTPGWRPCSAGPRCRQLNLCDFASPVGSRW